MSVEVNRSAAIEFLAFLGEGRAAEAAISSTFGAWTILSGDIDGQEYLRRTQVFPSIFKEPLTFIVDATTAEANRVVIQCHSQGVLINNAAYANTYVFVFLFAAGRVIKVFEYFNVKIALDVLIPVLRGSAS